ncbi:MAG: hypothetical protein K8R67_03655 [Desulfobacteraceae bacterium]|nr:hypothetical protein [Desulfobacteraceae bacterium]
MKKNLISFIIAIFIIGAFVTPSYAFWRLNADMTIVCIISGSAGSQLQTTWTGPGTAGSGTFTFAPSLSTESLNRLLAIALTAQVNGDLVNIELNGASNINGIRTAE